MGLSIDKLVFLLLFVYFSSRVTQSVLRLMAKRIGTVERKANNRSLLYPSITVCPFGDEVWAPYDEAKTPADLKDMLKSMQYTTL